jgi:hypothetical protein
MASSTAVPPTETPLATRRETAASERPEILDNVAYWVAIASIYLLQLPLWYHSGKSKLFDDDGTMPPPLKKQFDGTFFESVPGLDGAWVLLGVLQLVIVAILVGSLVRGEFLATRRKPLLLTGLATSMLVFASLLFGDIWTNQFDGAASLYAYFGATAVIFLFVLLMPPYRKANWLSGLTER